MTAAFTPASIADVLLLVKAQLASKTGLDASRVNVDAREPHDVPHTAGDQDVLVRPMHERTDPGMLEGGGRFNDRRIRDVEIVCRSRAYLDPVESDEVRLTDPALGILRLEDRVVDALENFQPADASGNVLAFPLYMEGPRAPTPDRDDPNWLSSVFTCEIKYVRKLDTSWL